MSSGPSSGQPDRVQRLSEILRRDGDRCVWCGRPFSRLVPATTDHLVPRVKGGPSWMENEVAACRRCNGQRGHRTPIDWLADCERRGWTPDTAALGTAFDALQSAICERGGYRRASRYLDAQRRRWAKR